MIAEGAQRASSLHDSETAGWPRRAAMRGTRGGRIRTRDALGHFRGSESVSATDASAQRPAGAARSRVSNQRRRRPVSLVAISLIVLLVLALLGYIGIGRRR